MTATSDLSDRDLCLGLAERLGWPVWEGPGQHFWLKDREGVGTSSYLEWLLTSAGCFAVLDAMRERGWIVDMQADKPDTPVVVWFRQFKPSYRAGKVKVVGLARAICEAAYDALEPRP